MPPCQALAALLCDAPSALAKQIMKTVQFMDILPPAPEPDSGPESDKDDVTYWRDAHLCSALLRNPSFINPFATFMFRNAAKPPKTDLEISAFDAVDFFIKLLGYDTYDLDFECVPELHQKRCVYV